MCGAHYKRSKTGADMGKPVRKPKATGVCGVPCVDGTTCQRTAKSLGYCTAHYQRFKAGLDMSKPLVVKKGYAAKACKTDDCDEDATRRGYCSGCYQRLRQTVPGFATGKRGVAVCHVDGCDRLVQSRDMCNLHYQRWQLNGDPGEAGLRRIDGTDAERFWPKVDKSGECWLWTGAIDSCGYGLFRGSEVRAHRMAYALNTGPIPEGMSIHHSCGVRHCVNPAHLEAVTTRENTIESLRCKALEAENARLVAENDQLQAELTAIKLGASVYAV